MRTRILFFLFALALIYGVLFMGVPIAQEHIEERQHRDLFLLAVAVLGIAGALSWGKVTGTDRTEDRILLFAAIALPCYVLLQLIPLPTFLVGILSPQRGALLKALEPISGHSAFASLSITPSATFSHFLVIAAYCVVFLAAREFTLREARDVWIVAAPVVFAGIIEAAMALIQASAGKDVQPKGTFGVRNHLAGFLAMAWPLAALYGVSQFRAGRRSRDNSGMFRAGAGFATAALLLAGAVLTLSRGGFLSILASGFVMAAFSVGRDMRLKKRLGTIALLCGGGALAFLYLTPESMVTRLSEHSSEGRTTVWREGIGVVREFPLVGTGMGGFESAFLKFKSAEGTFLVDYAHNDYLQYLAELGIAGFLILSTLIAIVVIRSFRRVGEVGDVRWIGLACLGSLTAILVHSALDFNMYVAANAAVLSWICGIAAGLTPSAPRLIRRRSTSQIAPDK